MKKRIKRKLENKLQDNITKVYVNGTEVIVPKNASVIQACEALEVYVPRFCYHSHLSVAGNCRICLVEVEKAPKLVASCAYPVMPEISILTETPAVKKAREGVIEILLANHPLDCPICDQGGECDLQDLAITYGSDRGRFTEYKRAVLDKDIGPLVKTIITRCIQCTRCVRFLEEVGGTGNFGTTGRGLQLEIGGYIDLKSGMHSELSGNIIDLCPVGALTSKPYAFTARAWELKRTKSLDVTDGVGSHIMVETKGIDVIRVLPATKEEINDIWITDKTRFSYDSANINRVYTPYCNDKEDDYYETKTADWPTALSQLAYSYQLYQQTYSDLIHSEVEKHANNHFPKNYIEYDNNGSNLNMFFSGTTSMESLIVLHEWFSSIGNLDRCQIYPINANHRNWIDTTFPIDLRSYYTLNRPIPQLEWPETVLLIGVDLAKEAPLLLSRLRKAYKSATNLENKKETLKNIGVIGTYNTTTYSKLPAQHLGTTAESFLKIAMGQSEFSKKLVHSERPLIIVNPMLFLRSDGKAWWSACQLLIKMLKTNLKHNIKTNWYPWAIIAPEANTVGAFELGFNQYSSNLDEDFEHYMHHLYVNITLNKKKWYPNTITTYIGSHLSDNVLQECNNILPIITSMEYVGTFLNTEGRAQKTTPSIYNYEESIEIGGGSKPSKTIVGKGTNKKSLIRSWVGTKNPDTVIRNGDRCPIDIMYKICVEQPHVVLASLSGLFLNGFATTSPRTYFTSEIRKQAFRKFQNYEYNANSITEALSHSGALLEDNLLKHKAHRYWDQTNLDWWCCSYYTVDFLNKSPVRSWADNSYQTDIITESSAIMAKTRRANPYEQLPLRSCTESILTAFPFV